MVDRDVSHIPPPGPIPAHLRFIYSVRCLCVYLYVHAQKAGGWGECQISSSTILQLFLKTEIIGFLLGWLTRAQQSYFCPLSVSLRGGVTRMRVWPFLDISGLRDLTLGSHACAQMCLSTETSPQPCLLISVWRIPCRMLD